MKRTRLTVTNPLISLYGGKSATLRRWSGLALLSLLLVTLILGCGGGQGSNDSASGKPKVVTVAYLSQVGNSGTIIKANHWLEKALPDTKVKWREFSDGASVVQAMASGNVDLGQAGSVPVVSAVAQGVPIKVIRIYDVIGSGEALAARPGINNIKDLVGKKVATPFGTTDQYSLITALRLNGIDPSSVNILDMAPQDTVAAFKRGDIDAAYTFPPGLTTIKSSGGKVLITSGELAKKGHPTADLGVASPKFATDHPDIVTEWQRLHDRGVKLYRKNPSKAVEQVTSDLSAPRDVVKATMAGVIWLDNKEQLAPQYMGTPGKPGQLANALDSIGGFMKKEKQISSEPSLSDFKDVVDPRSLKASVAKK